MTGDTSTTPGLPGQQCFGSISPGGSLLLESCDGGFRHGTETSQNVVLRDLGLGEEVGDALPSSGGATWAGTFSPDGQTFATLSDDFFTVGSDPASTSTVTVRDTRTMEVVGTYSLTGGAPPESGGIWDHVAYSRDGRLIAASTIDAVEVWDTASQHLVASPQSEHVLIYDMAFSPDGGMLGLALASGVVRVIDTSTWRDAVPPISFPADSIAFGQDSGTIAIADNGEVSLWDIGSGRRLGAAYAGPAKGLGIVRSLPDGRLISTVANEPAAIYQADPTAWKAQACAIVGDVSPAEWTAIAPDQAYRSPCGS
jgi:WD40 repeat protein